MEEVKHIYPAIADVACRAAKSLTVDDMRRVVADEMRNEEIFVRPTRIVGVKLDSRTTDAGIMRHAVVVVEYQFCSAVDGSEVTVVSAGEALDAGGLAFRKAMDDALDCAYSQLFGIDRKCFAHDDEKPCVELDLPAEPPEQTESVKAALNYIPFVDGDPTLAGKPLKELYKTMPDLISQLRHAGDDTIKAHVAEIDKYMAEYKTWKKTAETVGIISSLGKE